MQTVKTAVLANSTIWKVNEAVACKNCSVGKFNDLEGQSYEAIACKNCCWKANRTKQSLVKIVCRRGVGKFNDLEGQANCKDCGVGKFNDLEGQSRRSSRL